MSTAEADPVLSLVNGIPGDRVSVFDRALNYGDGLFETIRVVNSQAILESLHWQRLESGLQRLDISLATDTVVQQQRHLLAMAAAAGQGDGVIKIVVSRGEGGRGFMPAPDMAATIWCRWHSLPQYPAGLYQRGIELQLCHTRLPHRPTLAGLKHLNCLDYVMARSELSANPEREGLLLDQDGNLVEVCSANLFLVAGGHLLTPLLHRCGVAGTMRRWIIETVAARLKLSVREQELPLQALYDAREAFICNSVMGVVPVRCLERHSWPRGAITAAIQDQVMALFNA